ncbi:hypothetical protein TCAL_06286 [Tigriopus californicus]|uniref:Uncharacterized protein n=1 Tax=Tigriopus californicus TaxID=6832 RepID=A0A553NFU1_TIGCA|nr:hypothetical protein TCAL_06286 [Tigriopus californicus]|eukprot:TCALIF_06286-PA protein Name:"Protein of unknown function" AED:0.15 eAED:0.15 QI:120/1/1/1/0/0.5/2/71/112
MKLSLVSIVILAAFPLLSEASNFGRRGYPCESDADCGRHLICHTDLDGSRICRRDFCQTEGQRCGGYHGRCCTYGEHQPLFCMKVKLSGPLVCQKKANDRIDTNLPPKHNVP